MKLCISLFLGLVAIVLAGLYTVPYTHAQSSDRLLISTPFERGQDLSFFFSNSVIPLKYFETPEDPSVFIAIVTPEQLKAHVKAGFKPVIVDERAGNIDQYYLLYGTRFKKTDQYNLLLDDVGKNNGLELAYPVTRYITLVKVAPGLTIYQLRINDLDLKRAKPGQLIAPITQPANRTKVTSEAQTPENTNVEFENRLDNFKVAFSLLVMLAIIGTYVLQVKRAQNI